MASLITNFNLQPTLIGDLLTLRPLNAGDFELLYKVSSDPLVWEQHPENTRYKREVFERFFQGAIDSKGALIATDNNNGEVIGSSRYSGLNLEQKSIEVGYTFLARRCWGSGFNPEMKKLMLNHAFQHFDHVHFYIGEKNLRSQKAIENIGAKFLRKIGRKPLEGAPYFSVVYGIEKADFFERTPVE